MVIAGTTRQAEAIDSARGLDAFARVERWGDVVVIRFSDGSACTVQADGEARRLRKVAVGQ